jgi:glycosyltransferase involved in cell wall biosynthesis
LTSRPPRIVIFSAGIAEAGGAARRSRLIVEGLADRGWQVRVVTRAGTINRFRLRRSPDITILEVPGFGRRRTGAVLFLSCAFPLGLLWGRRASSFIAIQLLSQATVAAVCSLILRRPYIALATTSGEQVSEVRYILSEGRFRGLRRRLLRRASFLIAQTPEAARQLEAFLPAERVAVLPNPVAPVDAPPLNGLRHAIYTGRFSEEKDLPTLLEAWKEVASDSPDSMLTLVGEGGSYRSVEAELRTTVARTPILSSTVRLTGWVSDVGPFLSEADVYVFPSRTEGMSNSLLEACAWSRVVVASDIPANRAVLGDEYPLLFPVGDTQALIDALRHAFDNDDVRARARANIAKRTALFSVPTIMGRLEELLDAADSARH